MQGEWFLAAFSCELAERNSHIVKDLLNESIIIVRDGGGDVQAFYNVCRHRGSRICKTAGKGSRLTCPYHAWSYRLDGKLLAAAAMPAGTDTDALALRPVRAREVAGLILVSMAADPATLDDWAAKVSPVMEFHGMPDARIAAQKTYRVAANWKLVIENGLECYHCFPSHPEYCSMMDHAKALARIDAKAADRWNAQRNQWRSEAVDPASPGADYYIPIGEGFQTQSRDGLPVAPLMGRQSRFNGGMSGIGRPPFFSGTITNDHVVAFQILPVAAEQTLVTVTWLVEGSATPEQVDTDRMTWLWATTTDQDKTIIEDNAAGIRSATYTPGPYSLLEEGTAKFTSFYLTQISRHLSGEAIEVPDQERDFSASGLSDGLPALLEHRNQ